MTFDWGNHFLNLDNPICAYGRSNYMMRLKYGPFNACKR